MKMKQRNKIVFKKLKLAGGGYFLTILSMFCVGFSSWSINDSQKIGLEVEVSDVMNFDFSNSIFYVIGSEEGFDFYNFDNKRYYTDTTFSIKGKCRPDLLKEKYASIDVNVIFGLTYSYYTLENYDIFNSNNSLLEVPTNFKCQLEISENRFLYSNELSYYTTTSLNQTSYTLEGSLLVYSDSEPCLYSLTKEYQSGTNYVYFEILFDFINLDLNNDTIFPQLTFNFITNLKGVTS